MFGADRVDFRLGRSVAGLVSALTALASPAMTQVPAAPPLELRLADIGRFAAFVDMGAIAWTGRTARLRVLQVTEEGFTAGSEAFWGGWRYEVLDCDARTIAHAGFSSVRAGGKEGPISGDMRPAAKIPAGSADDAVAKVVCDGWKPYGATPAVSSVEDAVKIARPLIASGAEP